MKIFLTNENKLCSHNTKQVTTGKMQGLAFTGYVDFHIRYFECFVLAISINFKYVRNFLWKYGFMYEGVTYAKNCLYFFYHHNNPARMQ
jgi:hypothetical protein